MKLEEYKGYNCFFSSNFDLGDKFKIFESEVNLNVIQSLHYYSLISLLSQLVEEDQFNEDGKSFTSLDLYNPRINDVSVCKKATINLYLNESNEAFPYEGYDFKEISKMDDLNIIIGEQTNKKILGSIIKTHYSLICQHIPNKEDIFQVLTNFIFEAMWMGALPKELSISTVLGMSSYNVGLVLNNVEY
jgi:hypothetical protein